MKTLLFIDFETTGDDPNVHQAWEFACVPMINGVISLKRSTNFYIKHPDYTVQDSYLTKFGFGPQRMYNDISGVKIPVDNFPGAFREALGRAFTYPESQLQVTLGGKNVAGFDLKFLLKMAQNFKDFKKISYSCLDVGHFYMTKDDIRLPSLKQCRERAIEQGASLVSDNTHKALDDALLSAELYSWSQFKQITIER